MKMKQTSSGTVDKTIIPTSTNNQFIGVFPALCAAARLLTIAFVAWAMMASANAAGQAAQLTSPPPGSTLAYPSFTLAWQNVGAAQYWLYIGSQQGGYEYFGGSAGTRTSIGLTWSGTRPAGCWVRIWSRINVYSGNAGSTLAYSYWTYSDGYYQLASPNQPGSTKSTIIDDFVNAAVSVAGTVSDYQRGIKKAPVGQCKAFLAGKFNKVGKNYKLRSGGYPIMPNNSVPNEGVGVSNWYWQSDLYSGFSQVGDAVKPNMTLADKRDALMALLQQVRKGDTLQFVMKSKISNSGYKVTDYVPHTITFVENYSSDATPLNWVDSNMDGQGTPLVGTQWYWGENKTLSSLADRVATPFGGATLYRVRDDITRQ